MQVKQKNKYFKKRVGSGLLVMAFILCVITSITALTSAQLSNSMLITVQTNKTNVEAAELAQTKAALLRATRYDNLKSEAKAAVGTTGFFQQVTVDTETKSTGSSLKYKDITIQTFYGGEDKPRSILNLTRSTWNTTGCPIGTIIAWPADTIPNDGGVWLRCEGVTIPEKYTVLRSLLHSTSTPDFRGGFLRGYGSYDEDHQSAALGSYQADSLQRATGSFYTFVPQYIGNNPANGNSWKTNFSYFNANIFPTAGAFTGGRHPWEQTAIDRQDGKTYENYTYKYQINFDNQACGLHLGQEVIPVNTAVYFLIKAE